MAETSYDFDLVGPCETPAGDGHDNAAQLRSRIAELRRLLDMMEDAVSTDSGACDKYQANAAFAKIRGELVRIQLLLSSLPSR